MKIIFIGCVEFSYMSLKKLITLNAEIVGVCTLRKSNFNSDHVDLSSLCKIHQIPYIYLDNSDNQKTIDWIKSKNPDIIFCFGWSKIIKKDILDLAPMGAIGFHPAALPSNRGRHPIIWALVLGLKKTASTFFFMNTEADAGDIISQNKIHITQDDNARSLYDKIVCVALEQIEDFLPKLSSNSFKRLVQNHNLSNTWRKRNQIDGLIDWRMSAESIYNLTRGLSEPYIGAHFVKDNIEIKVWKVKVVKCKDDNIEPGKIFLMDEIVGPLIKCGQDAIYLEKTTPILDLMVGTYL